LLCEVEVDVETGHVKPIKMVHIQDGGLPLNRLTMESQINGGMIQSLGMALWEGRVMDAQLGMQLNPGLAITSCRAVSRCRSWCRSSTTTTNAKR
jgi:CO/xanthine dehydrogenase Mo-binding subunit